MMIWGRCHFACLATRRFCTTTDWLGAMLEEASW